MDTQELSETIVESGSDDLSLMIREYHETRRRMETDKNRIEDLRLQIIALMTVREQQSCRVKGGPLAYLKQDFRARINQDDQEAAFAWLRENGHGGLIKQKEEIHHGTLTAWAKERMEAGEEVPPCIKVSTFDTLCVEK